MNTTPNMQTAESADGSKIHLLPPNPKRHTAAHYAGAKTTLCGIGALPARWEWEGATNRKDFCQTCESRRVAYLDRNHVEPFEVAGGATVKVTPGIDDSMLVRVGPTGAPIGIAKPSHSSGWTVKMPGGDRPMSWHPTLRHAAEHAVGEFLVHAAGRMDWSA